MILDHRDNTPLHVQKLQQTQGTNLLVRSLRSTNFNTAMCRLHMCSCPNWVSVQLGVFEGSGLLRRMIDSAHNFPFHLSIYPDTCILPSCHPAIHLSIYHPPVVLIQRHLQAYLGCLPRLAVEAVQLPCRLCWGASWGTAAGFWIPLSGQIPFMLLQGTLARLKVCAPAA